MSENEKAKLVQVEMSPDKTEARLTVLPQLLGKPDAEAICTAAIQEQKIVWSKAVQRAVQTLLSEEGDRENPRSAVIARGTPAEPGKDGSVTWAVDQLKDESIWIHDTDKQPVDFYQRSAYVMVDVDQILGEVIEPGAGNDGVDVTGAAIKATAGNPANLKLDESIVHDADGRLIAKREGVLIRHPDGSALISEVLDIPGNVDFSTGNIEFDGDVVVREGVRDRFLINTAGNVEVYGLIEAATIHCGGNLFAHTGVAPRGHGQVVVQGDLSAKYLDNANIQVHGVLRIQKEAINSTILALGGVDSPQATIIGGEITLVGEARVASLGSEGAIATVVQLGRIPQLEAQIVQLDSIVEQLLKKKEPLNEELRLLDLVRPRLDIQQQQRKGELLSELGQIDEQLTRAKDAKQTLRMRIHERTETDLVIEKSIHPGVAFHVGTAGGSGGHTYPIHRMIRGPVKIHVKNGQATSEHSGHKIEPLSSLSHIDSP